MRGTLAVADGHLTHESLLPDRGAFFLSALGKFQIRLILSIPNVEGYVGGQFNYDKCKNNSGSHLMKSRLPY